MLKGLGDPFTRFLTPQVPGEYAAPRVVGDVVVVVVVVFVVGGDGDLELRSFLFWTLLRCPYYWLFEPFCPRYVCARS